MSFYIKGTEVPNATSYELYQKNNGEILYNCTQVPGVMTTSAAFCTDHRQKYFRNKWIAEIRLYAVKTGLIKIIKKTGVGALASTGAVTDTLDATVLAEITAVPGWNSVKFTTPIMIGDNEYLGTYNENSAIGYDNTNGTWGLHCWNVGSKVWKTYGKETGSSLMTIAMVVIEDDNYIPLATSETVDFDMSNLLPIGQGRYTFAVKAKADGYTDSIFSNKVDYIEKDIVKINEVIYASWIHNNTGEALINAATSWTSTDFIPVPDYATTISTEDITAFRSSTTDTITAPFAFYDKDKNYIGGVSEDIIPRTSGGQWRNSLSVAIPEGAAYVRSCWTITAYKHATTGVSTKIVEPELYWGYEHLD